MKKNVCVLFFILTLYACSLASMEEIDTLLFVSPLQQATARNDREKIKQLITTGADVNEQGIDNNTPLHIATHEGFQEAVELLLCYKATINSRNILGFTPLHNAVLYNHPTLVKYLLTAKANPNIPDLMQCSTPLHTAAYNKSYEIIRLLIQYGANINKGDVYYNNALAVTITKIVRELIHTEEDYRCAYTLIAAGSHIKIAFQDIQPGQLGYTIDKLRILAGDSTGWLNYPPNLAINEQDDLGATTLMYTAALGHIDTVMIQLNKGASPLLQDNYGRNVLRMLTIILNNKNDLGLTVKQQETYQQIMNVCKLFAQRYIRNLICIYRTHPAGLIKRKSRSALNVLPLDIFKIVLFFVTASDYNNLPSLVK